MERLNLCLHLLRLRSTPEGVKEWNKDSVESHQIHLTKSWTEFLRELPDGCTQGNLAQIYDLAKLEEVIRTMKMGCTNLSAYMVLLVIDRRVDANARFYWSSDPLKPGSKKKNPRSHDTSVHEFDGNFPSDRPSPFKDRRHTPQQLRPQAHRVPYYHKRSSWTTICKTANHRSTRIICRIPARTSISISTTALSSHRTGGA